MLKGGRSAEREVSLVSGRECAAALRQEGFDVVEIDAGADLASRARRRRGPTSPSTRCTAAGARTAASRASSNGSRIPYTHSGVLASALAMDKARAKEIFAAAGLPVARGHDRLRATRRAAAHPMPPPYVVKPNNEGSSVGVYLVPEGANGPAQLADDMPERGDGRGVRRRARADRRR